MLRVHNPRSDVPPRGPKNRIAQIRELVEKERSVRPNRHGCKPRILQLSLPRLLRSIRGDEIDHAGLPSGSGCSVGRRRTPQTCASPYNNAIHRRCGTGPTRATGRLTNRKKVRTKPRNKRGCGTGFPAGSRRTPLHLWSPAYGRSVLFIIPRTGSVPPVRRLPLPARFQVKMRFLR